ncbi:MAG: hypothetical protein V4613_07110 [Bacteroidota bacterium]
MKFKRILHGIMSQRLTITALLVICLLSACNDNNTFKSSPPDYFGQVVGRYKVIDSLYKNNWDLDSFGMPIYELQGVFHYPVVELQKGNVFDYDWNRMTEGILYTVIERDTTIYGKGGERSGLMGINTEFLLHPNTESIVLIDTRETTYATARGELKNNKFIFINSAVFGEYKSVAHFTKLP